jgi:hypothetical protein
MWAAIAFVAGLTAGTNPSDQLTILNLRPTYGVRGITRPDSKFLPGDQLFLTFDVDGITADDSGRVRYSISFEAIDASGKVLFKQTPHDQEAVIALGGNRLPAFVHVEIGLDQPPGEYTVRATVTDRAAKQSQTLSHTFEVLPKDFGIVRLTTTADSEGRIASGTWGSGDVMWVNLGVVGFERSSGQPGLHLELHALDEDGRPALARPFVGDVSQPVAANLPAVPAQFVLSLNRPGKFNVEVTAADKASGKTAKAVFPLTVLPTK